MYTKAKIQKKLFKGELNLFNFFEDETKFFKSIGTK